jgi:hypothetical protein
MSNRTAIPAVVETGEGFEPAQRHRDPRLPEPGTTLTRHIRSRRQPLELEVGTDSFRFLGHDYRTISGATKAACEMNGMKPQNGYLFWGLVKPERRPGVARKIDAVKAVDLLDRVWKRYHQVVSTIALHVGDLGDKAPAALTAIHDQANVVDELYGQGYDAWADREEANPMPEPEPRAQVGIADDAAEAAPTANPTQKKRSKRGVKARRKTGPVS